MTYSFFRSQQLFIDRFQVWYVPEQWIVSKRIHNAVEESE